MPVPLAKLPAGREANRQRAMVVPSRRGRWGSPEALPSHPECPWPHGYCVEG